VEAEPTRRQIMMLADGFATDPGGRVLLVREALRRWGRPATALAQPEPEGPTDEELMTAYWQGAGLAGAGTGDHILRGIRAVLTRYSRPAITDTP